MILIRKDTRQPFIGLIVGHSEVGHPALWTKHGVTGLHSGWQRVKLAF
jgi:hypothetical protein